MSIDYILATAILLHSIILVIVTYVLGTNKDQRTKMLWKLTVSDLLLFPVLILLAAYLQYPTTMLATLSYIVYSLVAAFVIAIEVPGFLLLSKFDGKIVGALENVRKDLVTIGYSFEHVAQLKATLSANEGTLRSADVYSLIEDFVKTCERMKNLDKSFWGLLLSEVTRSARFFSERSKNPFPKLLDILSLAGLSFLLAQFLKLIG